MPSSWGRWGATPEWATTGRDPSALCSARLIDAVEHAAVPGRELLPAASRAATGAAVPVPTAAGRPRRRHRLVVAAPQRDRRVVAEQVDQRLGPGARPACGCPGRSAPCSGMSCHSEQARLVGRVVELGPGHVGVDAHQVEPGLDRQLDVAAQLGRRGLAERHAGRPEVGALEEQPLAVDRGHPARRRTERSPVRSRRSSLTRRAGRRGARRRRQAGRRRQHDRDPQRRAATASPRARGHHSSGRSIVTVQLTSLAPAASGWSTSWSSAPTSVRSRTRRARVAVEHGPQRQHRPLGAGLGAQHPQRRRCAPGPVSVSRTGRQMPPGFQLGIEVVAAWNAPVRLRCGAPCRAGAST